jgi:hypothetical protein
MRRRVKPMRDRKQAAARRLQLLKLFFDVCTAAAVFAAALKDLMG